MASYRTPSNLKTPLSNREIKDIFEKSFAVKPFLKKDENELNKQVLEIRKGDDAMKEIIEYT